MDNSTAALSLDGETLRFTGAIDARAAERLWSEATTGAAKAKTITLDKVTELDSIGAVMLLGLDKPLDGAPPNIAEVLERNRRALESAPPVKPEKELPAIQALGAGAIRKARTFAGTLAYIGEVTMTTLRAPFQRGGIRPAELMRHLDEAGLRAFPLTILLGTLIGVILAFQSSIPLKRFGAEIFVPNLVGISLLRELGPLMAAIIMSGRTGSAYAAELGTMVVNEEVDALRIMGVDAIAMLVLPRIMAACLAMPVLALVMDLTGLIGMTGVMAALGFPFVAVTSQLKQWLSLKDLLGGLFKAAVFGAAIGLIGCRAGLSAARGPRAVGDAATGAVVGGIVAIIILDGVFAILFYRLGL
ncbi:MlaE family ABC transporter permease [Plastoroseomonas arctica]|uniref:ABC transporter permease n=1 Tax=Plastoroseomonas arctica TaxID=1509237 RepID=A0AAF1JUU6_9PROT|nr:ABC transporter permease [Plastoroseomonas arctica]MBR0654250.1 ABC transporter permease [Plastoroseomonas arctica]